MAVVQNVSGGVGMTIRFNQAQTTNVVGQTSGGGSQTLQGLVQIADTLINATGASYGVDQLFSKQISLSASTPQTLHFGNGTQNDMFGNAITMARIRMILVQNVTATPGYDVKVESSASNGIPWLPASSQAEYARANQGLVIVYDPLSAGGGVGNVIGATTDGMTLDPGSNACVVNVIVAGSSTA